MSGISKKDIFPDLRIDALEEQLAQSQHREAELREALVELIKVCTHTASGRGAHVGFKRIMAQVSVAKQALAGEKPDA